MLILKKKIPLKKIFWAFATIFLPRRAVPIWLVLKQDLLS